MEREALTLESLSLATAARNSGGLVIVQVERLAERGTLNSRQVKIPGILVDCVVVAEKAEYHQQTVAEVYSPAYSGEIRVPADASSVMLLTERKIIARRAALELQANAAVNLGIGMPEGVASVAAEERVSDLVTLTAEPGVIGGIPAGGLNFGATVNASAIIDQPYQFDFYDGGGLDLAVLGLAQADVEGNLNVSKFGARLAGAGGFINIRQNARKLVFVGTFTADGLDTVVEHGKLVNRCEGRTRKFVRQVEHRTFSGSNAHKRRKPVLYVTERCVFSLTDGGLELIEVAPGIDIARDILALMDFAPLVRTPRLMDAKLFQDAPMGLRDTMLAIPFARRFSYDAGTNVLFINFEHFAVKSEDDVEQVRVAVETLVASLGHKVYAIVNYNKLSIEPAMFESYSRMVRYLVDSYYLDGTRYATSGFLRMKLGDELQNRGIAPHIYESADDARAHLKP